MDHKKPSRKTSSAQRSFSEEEFQRELEKAKFSSLAEFAAGAGHDLNNPLAAILGRAQLLLKLEENPIKRGELSAICANVHRAQEMISDLRLISQAPRPEFQKISVIQILENIHQHFQSTLLEQEILWKVEYILPDGQKTKNLTDSDFSFFDMNADPAQLHVLISSLVKNSLRAIMKRGEILFLINGSQKDKISIQISDTGHGIPEEIRPLIFDPFFSSYQAGRGLGFGLTKARIITQMHGGKIELLTNRPLTTFCVTLQKNL
ncbi:MAG: HAMP domain-containing sensor histidine kinase [Planctomycetia bacterium]|nr:HAMP domain-containing sensor histidine kinase [Planctomycetia bacterium]